MVCKLSILIPTLKDRALKYNRLVSELHSQIYKLNLHDAVEILTDDRNRSITTGEKRNDLIANAKGLYTVFIDDDDIISNDYLEQIFKAIETSPDVITFKGFMTTNGTDRYNFELKLNLKYTTINKTHYRFPNHLCPMKRSLIKDVKFEHITLQEDIRWATKIRDLGLLKNEYHINNELYHYDFIKNK